jgi:ABC-2 type transport system permease protein
MTSVIVDVPADVRRVRHEDEHVSERRRVLGLIWALSRKNFQVRYKRASLGVLWAVVQPLFQTALLSFVFLVVFPGTAKRIPYYPAFVLSGMLPWAFFSQSLAAATTSIVDNASLVRKVAVPSVVFPVAAVGGVANAFLASLGIMLVTSLVVGQAGFEVLLLPLAAVLQTALILSLGVLTCAFQVALRDTKYLVDAGLMAFFYATPVLYSIERVPEKYRPLFEANPMSGVLSLYRAATLGRPIAWSGVAVSVVVTVVLGVLAAWAHRSRSGDFADAL